MVQGIGECLYTLLPPNVYPDPQAPSDIRENQLGPVGLQAPVNLHNVSFCLAGAE